jgi:hypothetical protein
VGQVDGGRHDVLVALGRLAQLVERPLDRVAVPLGPPRLELGDGLGLQRRVDLEDGALRARRRQRRGLGLGEAVDPHHRQLAVLDVADPLGVAAHQPALELVDGLEGAAQPQHLVQLGGSAGDQLGGAGLDHLRPLEQVGVLQQVGLEGQHLLHAQRPLLVPRSGQAQRLVPRRQLERPGAGIA